MRIVGYMTAHYSLIVSFQSYESLPHGLHSLHHQLFGISVAYRAFKHPSSSLDSHVHHSSEILSGKTVRADVLTHSRLSKLNEARLDE